MISEKDLLKRLEDRPPDAMIPVAAVRQMIYAMPTIDAVKHGIWTIEDCHSATYKYCCSECEAHHRTRYNFCPTCGAIMDA